MTTIKEFLEGVNSKFEETPYEINNGCCEEWAEEVKFNISKTYKFCIWETVFGLADTIHLFVQIDGRFYDAECLDGVDDYMQLPIFKKLLRPQPVIAMDGNYSPEPSRYFVTDEDLVEAGYGIK